MCMLYRSFIYLVLMMFSSYFVSCFYLSDVPPSNQIFRILLNHETNDLSHRMLSFQIRVMDVLLIVVSCWVECWVGWWPGMV